MNKKLKQQQYAAAFVWDFFCNMVVTSPKGQTLDIKQIFFYILIQKSIII